MDTQPKNKSCTDGMVGADDRRSEPRHPAAGEVRLYFADPLPLEVQAHLVDTSRNGFRVCHGFPGFSAGQEIHFRHDHDHGIARVMWNSIQPEGVETGFLIVSR